MFRPESLQRRTKQIKSNNKKNEENRKRNRILNFRVSEEYDLINKQIEISGLSKQEYFIQLLREHQIKIIADYRVLDAISKEIFQLAKVVKKFGKLNEEEQNLLLYIIEIYEEIKQEKSLQPKDQRQDESTTWYFIPDKTILSGCTSVSNIKIGGQNDKNRKV